MAKKVKGFLVQRQKGESYEHWAARCREVNIQEWLLEKKNNGQWLSKEEYEKKTGRPGKKN